MRPNPPGEMFDIVRHCSTLAGMSNTRNARVPQPLLLFVLLVLLLFI